MTQRGVVRFVGDGTAIVEICPECQMAFEGKECCFREPDSGVWAVEARIADIRVRPGDSVAVQFILPSDAKASLVVYGVPAVICGLLVSVAVWVSVVTGWREDALVVLAVVAGIGLGTGIGLWAHRQMRRRSVEVWIREDSDSGTGVRNGYG